MAKKDQRKATNKRNYVQYLVPLLIIIATLVVYNPAMKYGFLDGWDDMEYLNDPAVQQMDLGEIFSNYHLGMYQPLSVSTIAMNFRSAELGPGAYHATNLFLHILNIFLVWLFLLQLSRKRLIAGIGAFLFALHPLNLEPVVWIAARSTLLLTLFYMAGLLAYLRYTENKKNSLYTITLLFAILAFFSKSLAMSFPFVLLIIDYLKGRSFNTRVWLEKAPFFALSVIFGIVAIYAADTYGHISGLAQDYNLLDRFFILCHTYVFYLVKLLVPIELSAVYTYPDNSGGSLSLLYYPSTLVPLGLIYLVYKVWNKQKEIVAGILFFSITVAPVLPILWSRVFVAADRYAYLSFIGLFLILAFLFARITLSEKVKTSFLRYMVWGIAVLYGAGLIYLTHDQMKYWKDPATLLGRAVSLSETSPNKALAYFYRGNIFQNIAEEKFSTGYSTNNRNMVLNSQAFYRLTIADYDSCLVHDPEYMLAYTNRGIAYMSITQYDTNYRTKYATIAKQDFQKAISLDSTYADNYYNLAWAYWIEKDVYKACELWRKADELGSAVAYQPLETYCK